MSTSEPATATDASARPVQALFAPTSVAVIGASDDERKWGNWLARGALRGAHRRPAYLVNRRADTVLGQAAFPSLRELPGPADLVVIAVPASGLDAAIDDALGAGARAIVAITAGSHETPDAAAGAGIARHPGARRRRRPARSQLPRRDGRRRAAGAGHR